MIRTTAAALLALTLATPAYADDAMDKCLADTKALGAKDPIAGCTCFFDKVSDEEREAYAEISDWASEASEAMKDAGAACFPELQ